MNEGSEEGLAFGRRTLPRSLVSACGFRWPGGCRSVLGFSGPTTGWKEKTAFSRLQISCCPQLGTDYGTGDSTSYTAGGARRKQAAMGSTAAPERYSQIVIGVATCRKQAVVALRDELARTC